ncbi:MULTISPECIES: host-nuclease inhibitor Gam family protein [unclassified Lysinibacillus]|uniref:host-nuclease inhibitor Gam family protein n=1 Tax=unclassified Lysinibacillus TaxID=2636778 RepID=UPI003815D57A
MGNSLRKYELEAPAPEIVEGEQTEETKQRYEITNLESLNWAFRQIANAQAELKKNQALADAEYDRIKRWQEDESKSHINTVEFFQHLIAEYHTKELAENPKKKTISTPYGKSKSTTSSAQPDKPTNADEEKLLEFVKANKKELVKTVEEVQWGEFKKTLKVVEIDGVEKVIDENGQDVPGVTIKPKNTTFKVETI